MRSAFENHKAESRRQSLLAAEGNVPGVAGARDRGRSVCSGKVQFERSHPKDSGKRLQHGDALLIVDVQRDFLPGGSLAISDGDEVIQPLNRYLAMFVRRNLPVFASGDWHPPDHCSFVTQGGPWPPHCIANTPGAAFATSLCLPDTARVIHKGRAVDRDAYSAFQETDLDVCLHQAGVTRLFIGGLATDYCVLRTMRDALQIGYPAMLLRDAVRAVNLRPDHGDRAEADMIRRGAEPIQVEDLVHAT